MQLTSIFLSHSRGRWPRAASCPNSENGVVVTDTMVVRDGDETVFTAVDDSGLLLSVSFAIDYQQLINYHGL